MPVEITDKTEPGQLYLGKNNDVAQLISYCMLPTATIENVLAGSQTGGGVGCLNLASYKPVEDCTKEELIKALNNMVSEFKKLRDEKFQLWEEMLELKQKLIDLRFANLSNA